ncbi:hypothetical protein FHS14_002795 [Paenibacillus baekrokdamisoli]|nr:hypothetical protein [Paenibacillus baekrokdamisoli]MBB3069800.1 hypothetical protein [Paenibacillus baekrokdamisoli]
MAIPRAPETSSQQSHALQKPVMNQIRLENETVKQTELLRGKNTAIEHNVKLGIHDQQHRESHSLPKRKNQGKLKKEQVEDEVEQIQKHPYKGQHIDISL